MRALVTGGGGFLGRYIVEKLIAQGHNVRVLARGSYPELKEIGVELMQGDVRNRDVVIDACKSIDVVFHTAAKVGHWGRWQDFYDINVGGTKHILEGCKEHDVQGLIYTSSASVVFDYSDLCNADETSPYPKDYNSYYAATKSMAEQLVIASKSESGLLTVSLRPHLVWGPRDNHLIPGILENARKGRLVRIGKKRVITDFTYVDNVADAHLLAADQLAVNPSISGQTYFISQDEPIYIWDFVNQLLERLNIRTVKKQISANMARVLATVSETSYKYLPFFGEPRLTRFLAGQLAHSHYFNIAKATRDLGYRPQVSMAEGFEKMINYIKENKY